MTADYREARRFVPDFTIPIAASVTDSVASASHSVRLGGLETSATADRRDHQVEAGVLRQATFFDDVFGRAMRGVNLHQHIAMQLVMLAKVHAEAALSIMD